MLIVSVLITRPAGVRGDEPHLEFVRGLRARGLPDLALEYLEKLSRQPPPDIAAILPLEIAKSRLDMGTVEPDAGRRTAIQNQAKAGFEAFIRTNPKHPLAAEAAFEIAHITSLQGQTQLNRALQIDAKDARRVGVAKARLQFEEAGRQLQAAAGRIQGQLDALGAAATSQGQADQKSLSAAALQADLEQGINLIRQAQTYLEQGEEDKRGEILKKAMETLTRLASQRDTIKKSVCWQALAWLGYAQLENEDPKAARKIFADVIAETGEHAEAGRRLARYFRMQTYAKDPDIRNVAGQIQQAGDEWLRIYPEYLNTWEGYGVRFELANAYLAQAVKPQQSQRGRELYEKALRLFQGLEQTENEFTARAHEKKLNIILVVSQERSKGDVSKLKDFEECYLRAQLEVAQLNQEAKKADASNTEGQREQHFKNIVLALSRAVELVDDNTPREELNDARYMLAYACMVAGDYYRAAVWGEELARTQPTFHHSALAGAYALRSYALIVANREQSGAANEDLAPERERMRTLARYIEQSWPSDPAADIARHTLGIVSLAEKNYPDAVEALDRISPGYSDSTRAIYQLAGAALQAEKEEDKPPQGRPAYQARAVAALLRIPELAAPAEPGTVQAYFAAKLMLADIYYRTKQYEQLQALAESLLKSLEGLDEKTKTQHQANVLALKLYAELGKAEAHYTAGRYTKARESLDPIVERIKDPAEAKSLADKDPRLLRALLGLALRANVQDSKLNRGKDVLELLQKTSPENSIEILVQFVQQLNNQVQLLRERGEAGKQDLDRTVTNFTMFLDELARQQEKTSKPDIVLFLAGSYSSLDNHQKAAALANWIAEPSPADNKADAKAAQLYHVARVLYTRELRLAKDFIAAQAALNAIQATDWGRNNLEARKESVLILEDQEMYAGKGGAILAWNNLMQQLRPRLSDNKIKEQYFDCYYHLTCCIFKNALKMNDPQKKARDIRVAANFIIKLETQPDGGGELAKRKFTELLEKEPLLKERYEELRKSKQ
jgi:hypothetical protein